MKLESIPATTERVAKSTHSTKRITQQWSAYAAVFAVVLTLAAVATPASQAQTFTVLYTFLGGTDGGYPSGALVRDPAGNLYGTTPYGGATRCSLGCGVVFELDPTGKENVLHSFTGGADGANPSAFLVRDKAGNLYGTTTNGGNLNCGGGAGCGVVFKLGRNRKQTVLHRFAGGADGEYPNGGLVRDSAGDLYGPTFLGGTNGSGIVFKLSPTRKETVLHSFPASATDGDYPNGLVEGAAGILYGTTRFGGVSDLGTVFKLNGTGKETVLDSFEGTQGEFPFASLILDRAGNLYGTTEFGGDLSCNAPSSGCGTVFKFDTRGKEKVLYSFLGVPDGDAPLAPLVWGANGALYGTTTYGGAGACQNPPQSGCGTIFRVDKTGKETLLYSFTGGTDGKYPFAGLIRDSAGNLYGTASQGAGTGCGSNGCGVVFKLTP